MPVTRLERRLFLPRFHYQEVDLVGFADGATFVDARAPSAAAGGRLVFRFAFSLLILSVQVQVARRLTDDERVSTYGSESGSGSSDEGGSSSGSSNGAGCSPSCGTGMSCCGARCVNLQNDPRNCGVCGTACGGATPFCSGGCRSTPCSVDARSCPGGSCCGDQCCGPGQMCCLEQAGVLSTQCYTPTSDQPSCPIGCPMCVSDRNLKRDIEPVDPQAVLERVAHLPVSTWSYKSDEPAVRHMGPMAQDFKASFGLGNTDKAYNSVDAHGVALAAIQALYSRVEAQGERIERLERENTQLRTQCK